MEGLIDQGADPARLRAVAGDIDVQVKELGRVLSAAERRFDALDWTGSDASRFRSQYRGSVSAASAAAVRALTTLSRQLHQHADEQENAARAGASESGNSHIGSGGGGGGGGGGGWGTAEDISGILEQVKKLLGDLGVGPGLVEDILKRLESLAELGDEQSIQLLAQISERLDGDLLAMFKAVDKLVPVATFALDFFIDLTKSGLHSFDEAMIHAASFAGANFAASQGIDKGIQVATTAALGAITAGIAAPAAAILGEVVGTLVSQAVDHLAGDAIDAVADKLADVVTEAYQWAKALDFDPVAMSGAAAAAAVQEIGETVGELWDDATDLAGGVADMIGGLFK